jgi:uncharacterized membrane protein
MPRSARTASARCAWIPTVSRRLATECTALGEGLLRLWPSYVAYAVSFLLIGTIWINHHAVFRHIVRADGTLLALNRLHLMVVAFFPFPTAVLADAFHRRTDEQIAAALYGGTLAVGGVFVTAMWLYAAHGGRLLGAHLTAPEARQISRRFLAGTMFYVGAAAVGLVLPSLAVLLYASLIVFFLLPGQMHEDLPARAAGDGEGGPPPPGTPGSTKSGTGRRRHRL